MQQCKTRMPPQLQWQSPLDAGGVHDAARDLLDRGLTGIEYRDGVTAEERIGGAQLVLHLCARGVAAVRATLGADLLQPLRPDSEPVELAAKGAEPPGQ